MYFISRYTSITPLAVRQIECVEKRPGLCALFNNLLAIFNNKTRQLFYLDKVL